MTVVPQLAALLYYDAEKAAGNKTHPAFESLESDQQAPFLRQAERFMVLLKKLNLVVEPVKDEALTPAAERDILVSIIEALCKSVTLWKREYFPIDELALQIQQRGFHVR